MTGGILFCLVLLGFIAIKKIHGDSQKRPIPLVTYLLPPLEICGLKKWKLGKMVAESCYINQVILEITSFCLDSLSSGITSILLYAPLQHILGHR